jgi:hypothetical protein
MKKLIALLISMLMFGIVYAINSERPSENLVPEISVIEVFGYEKADVNQPIIFNPDIQYFRITAKSIYDSDKDFCRIETEKPIVNTKYLKRSGTARICGLNPIYNIATQKIAFKYKEVRIRGVDYNIYLHANIIGAVENNYKEVRIRGVDINYKERRIIGINKI